MAASGAWVGTMGAGGGACEAMRAELLRPGLSGGRGSKPPGCSATGATATGVTAGFSTFAGAIGLALAARGFDSDLAADFGMVLITDLVSGLTSLPEAPGLAGTGLATACLRAAGVSDLAEDFLASDFAAGNAFLKAGLVAADLDEASGRTGGFDVGFAASFNAGFGVDFTTGLIADFDAGFTAGFTAVLAGDLAGNFPDDLAAGLAGGFTGLPDVTTALLAGLGAGVVLAVVFNPLRTTGFAVALCRVFPAVFIGAAGFFLAVLAAAFMIGLLWKSAPHAR